MCGTQIDGYYSGGAANSTDAPLNIRQTDGAAECVCVAFKQPVHRNYLILMLVPQILPFLFVLDCFYAVASGLAFTNREYWRKFPAGKIRR